jgi:hypothetical protein
VTIADVVYPGHCFYDDYHLFVYLNNMSIIDGFPIFSNPANLETIVENSYGIVRTYNGYTILTSINGEYGNCNAVLRKSTQTATIP